MSAEQTTESVRQPCDYDRGFHDGLLTEDRQAIFRAGVEAGRAESGADRG